jgi:hypothetical protein
VAHLVGFKAFLKIVHGSSLLIDVRTLPITARTAQLPNRAEAPREG